MRARVLLRFGFSVSSLVVVTIGAVSACVGDDPMTSSGTTPSSDGGSEGAAPDSGDRSEDGGGGDAAIEDAGADVQKRRCETVPRPLAPREFFCADFDGTDVSEGWTDTYGADGGVLEVTTDAFVSAPHGLLVHPPKAIGNGSGPQLQWKSVGAKNFVKAELRAHMNPTNPGGVTSYDGAIKLLEIKSTNALVALYYTNGGALASASSPDPYTGYFIKTAAFGGAAAQSDYPIAAPLAPTTWTDVKLTWEASGQATLSYNNVSVFNKNAFGSTDTSITFSVGAASSGAVSEPKSMRYDDVEITLDRAE